MFSARLASAHGRVLTWARGGARGADRRTEISETLLLRLLKLLRLEFGLVLLGLRATLAPFRLA